MKIRVDDVRDEERRLELREPPRGLNDLLEIGSSAEIHVDEDLAVDLVHYRLGDDLLFQGTVKAPSTATCARCLEEFPLALDRRFRIVLRPGDDGSADDVEVGTYEGDEVDLAPYVHEEILLGLPTTVLCREDCAGLCAGCGVNLDREACVCPPSEGDPRLAVLRKLARPES